MITLGENDAPNHCSCAPGFSGCAKRAVKTHLGRTGGCPDGTKCISFHHVKGASEDRAESFLRDAAHALVYITARRRARAAQEAGRTSTSA